MTGRTAQTDSTYEDFLTLLRASHAPPARTLVDIFQATVEEYPDDPAIDNGASVLTYREFAEAADEVAAALNGLGIGLGDRVGVRIRSGTVDLYVAIMGILVSGGCYVPVDADDPDERARTVFDEADVAAIIGNDWWSPLVVHPEPRRPPQPPSTDDDAWVIFTSGSTGTPKGVAVSHRSAAGLVDAEARLYLQERPARSRRPGDGRSLGRLRRLLRGDVARLEVRRLLGPRTSFAGPQRHGARPLARGQRHHRGVDRSHAAAALAGRGPRRRTPAHPRRRGLPSRDRRAFRLRSTARCGTPTDPPRPRSSRAPPG